MLVLSRKKGENFILKVGDKTIEILVLEDKNNEIKIGFKADKEVKIYRGEIYNNIVNQNKDSLNINVEMAKLMKNKINRGNDIEN